MLEEHAERLLAQNELAWLQVGQRVETATTTRACLDSSHAKEVGSIDKQVILRKLTSDGREIVLAVLLFVETYSDPRAHGRPISIRRRKLKLALDQAICLLQVSEMIGQRGRRLWYSSSATTDPYHQ